MHPSTRLERGRSLVRRKGGGEKREEEKQGREGRGDRDGVSSSCGSTVDLYGQGWSGRGLPVHWEGRGPVPSGREGPSGGRGPETTCRLRGATLPGNGLRTCTTRDSLF